MGYGRLKKASLASFAHSPPPCQACYTPSHFIYTESTQGVLWFIFREGVEAQRNDVLMGLGLLL